MMKNFFLHTMVWVLLKRNAQFCKNFIQANRVILQQRSILGAS